MKFYNIAVILLLLVFGFLAGCSAKPAAEVDESNGFIVMTTIFPLYDFAKAIGGEHVQVISLLPPGADAHDWEPKSQDMVHISKAGLLIYQGAGFESWMQEVLDGIDTNSITIVEASEGIELIPAEEDGHGHGGYDPHTWLSPRSALIMAENIYKGLKEADPAHAQAYEANFSALSAELEALHLEYLQQLSNITKRDIVVSHQAFGYLARDYGLEQWPLTGLSAEGEPTAQDLKAISEIVQERGVTHIFTEQFASDRLAKALAEDLGIETLPLHPLEGLSKEEAEAGESYVSLMRRNLEHLVTALK